MDLMLQIEDDPGTVRMPDAEYSHDHFFDEPHNQPVTIKLKESTKRRLQDFARAEGYTTLSAAVRELIILGLKSLLSGKI